MVLGGTDSPQSDDGENNLSEYLVGRIKKKKISMSDHSMIDFTTNERARSLKISDHPMISKIRNDSQKFKRIPEDRVESPNYYLGSEFTCKV